MATDPHHCLVYILRLKYRVPLQSHTIIHLVYHDLQLTSYNMAVTSITESAKRDNPREDNSHKTRPELLKLDWYV